MKLLAILSYPVSNWIALFDTHQLASMISPAHRQRGNHIILPSVQENSHGVICYSGQEVPISMFDLILPFLPPHLLCDYALCVYEGLSVNGLL